MSAQILDGKAIAADIRIHLKEQVQALLAGGGRQPGLAQVLVGENPASQIYVRNKGLQAREAGMNSFEYRLPATATQGELLGCIAELNQSPAVNGILVQLPLPKQIDPEAVIEAIAVAKDHVVAVATGSALAVWELELP